MYSVDGNEITLSRGDSFSLKIQLKNRQVADGSTGLFTMKKKPKMSAEALVEKTVTISGNQAEIVLDSEDTKELSARTYYWDFRVIDPDGLVSTPMEYAGFTILEVIGNV